jgi:hypothetical protein
VTNSWFLIGEFQKGMFENQKWKNEMKKKTRDKI